MNTTPQQTLSFVNTYLREPSEKRLTEGEFARIRYKGKGLYDLKWQVAVRRFFFGNKPFNRLKT